MSLTDPVAARHARAERRRPIVRVVLTLLLLTSSAVTGVTWGVLIVSGFESADAALQVAAIVSAIIAWISYLAFSIATFGSWRAGPVVLGIAFALLGLGLLGARLNGGGSVLEFPGWLGLVFLSLGLLIWVLGFVSRASRRRRAEQQQRTLASGVATTATVTDVPRGPSPSSRGLWAAVTFTFTDRGGTQRWVERPMLIRREGDVKIGDTTQLWYDAADPGNDRSIVVELAKDNPLRMPV